MNSLTKQSPGQKVSYGSENLWSRANPNSKARSRYVLPCQRVPSRCWSAGCTGTILYALEINSTALSTEAYEREQNDDGMSSLILRPLGEDKSTISRHLCECGLGTKPIGLVWTRAANSWKKWANKPSQP